MISFKVVSWASLHVSRPNYLRSARLIHLSDLVKSSMLRLDNPHFLWFVNSHEYSLWTDPSNWYGCVPDQSAGWSSGPTQATRTQPGKPAVWVCNLHQKACHQRLPHHPASPGTLQVRLRTRPMKGAFLKWSAEMIPCIFQGPCRQPNPSPINMRTLWVYHAHYLLLLY